MKIEVLFFAQLAETFGPRCEIKTREGSSIAGVVDPFFEKSQDLEALRDSIVYAVNERYETSDAVLYDGDRLAILPPMSGG